jgi:very-short-patch-repair endonuclease
MGVGALPGVTVGDLQRMAGAVLRHGPGVMLGQRSATWLWGAPVPGSHPVDLITARPYHRTQDPGVLLHRPRDGATLRAVRHRGLPVTTPVRTLLDLGAVCPEAVRPAVETFVRDGRTTTASLRSALARARRRGRPGIAALAAALDDVGPVVTDSELESRMRSLSRRTGLDGWVFHERVEGYEVDFCFHDVRLIVEVDGWERHGADRPGWERTLDRDFVLSAVGWLVVHVSWRMVTQRPDACVARLRAALAGRSGQQPWSVPGHR